MIPMHSLSNFNNHQLMAIIILSAPLPTSPILCYFEANPRRCIISPINIQYIALKDKNSF